MYWSLGSSNNPDPWGERKAKELPHKTDVTFSRQFYLLHIWIGFQRHEVCHYYKVSRCHKNVLLQLQIQINPPRSQYNVINKFGNVCIALTILAPLIPSLDLKFMNNFKNNIENIKILKVHFHILCGTLYSTLYTLAINLQFSTLTWNAAATKYGGGGRSYDVLFWQSST
jgi:hypothetical protein